jgi:hypothetical protein
MLVMWKGLCEDISNHVVCRYEPNNGFLGSHQVVAQVMVFSLYMLRPRKRVEATVW